MMRDVIEILMAVMRLLTFQRPPDAERRNTRLLWEEDEC